MAHDVFISYSMEDREIADQACMVLERNGIRCWMAPRDILPGMFYAEAIIDAISTARILVLIFTSNANNSGHVMRELERAVSNGLTILPFRIKEVEPSPRVEYYVAASQWLDAYTPPMEQHLISLTNTLQKLLEQEEIKQSAPSRTHPVVKCPQDKNKSTLTWRRIHSDLSSLWLHIFHSTSSTFRFGIVDDRQRVLVSGEAVRLSKDLSRIIHNALAKLDQIKNKKERWAAYARLGNLMYRSVLPCQIQDIIDHHEGGIILVTEDLTLPWELLHDHTGFLCVKRPFSRMPESFRWADVLFPEGTLPASRMDKVLVIADPVGDLPETRDEASKLNALFEEYGISCDILVGPSQCSYLNIKEKLNKGNYAIIHFSGHMLYLSGRQTSAIVLANEQLFPAEEICTAFRGSPLVFLNAHHGSAGVAEWCEGPWEYAPRNIRAMAQTFVYGGNAGRSKAIIGTMWTSDFTSIISGFSTNFYKHLLAGKTVGEAMASGRLEVIKDHEDVATGLSFALFGNPHISLHIKHLTNRGKIKMQKARVSDETRSEWVWCETHKESDNDLLSEGPPWSDEVRVALLGAIGSMHAMNWPFLSSVHLLLGLTYLPTGFLSKALSDKGLDPNEARRAVRGMLKKDRSRPEATNIEISRNFLSLLKLARKLAVECGAEVVEERHLVARILEEPRSGAHLILSMLEIDLDKLKDSLGLKCSNIQVPQQPPFSQKASVMEGSELFEKGGMLNTELFDDSCWKALKKAVEIATIMNWDDIRTPHVFLGILNRNGSILEKRISRLNLGFRLSDLFFKLFQKPHKEVRKRLLLRYNHISRNTLKLLWQAHRLAKASGRSLISEDDLLKAILLDEQNIVTQILKKNRIDISYLLDLTLH